MKIAFDKQIFKLQKYGGISRYVTNLANELQDIGVNAHIFEPGFENIYLKSLDAKTYSNSWIENLTRKLNLKKGFRSYSKKVAEKKITKWKPDLLHETYYQRQNLAPSGTPTILTVYDMIHELFPDDWQKDDSTSENKRAAVERAEHIICISNSTRNDLIDLFGVSPDKISVTHLGFTRMEHTPEPNIRFSSKPYLLYVGHRVGYKNFDVLLEAYLRSENLREKFDIVAFGGPTFSQAEYRNFDEQGLKEGQIRHDSGSDELLSQYYTNAAAFIYPSLYEGFGLPPLEAMALACPVISSNTSSMPEVIGEAAEFFDPNCADALITAIERVTEDGGYQLELKEKGKRRVEYFSWEKCAQETLDIYKQVLGVKE